MGIIPSEWPQILGSGSRTKISVMANWLLHSSFCIPSPVSLSFPLRSTFPVLPFVLSVSVSLSLSLSLCLLSLSFTSPFLALHLSLLFPPPLLLFPLFFRLCKVQLGFGAFGLQAWRQEDALSEYALLGSLCVTLYFFALSLFDPSSLLTFVLIFLYSCYLSSHGRPVFPVGFLLWRRKTLCFWYHQCQRVRH